MDARDVPIEVPIELSSRVSFVVLGVMGNTAIYVMPLLVGGMITERGFSDRAAGYIAAADLAGFALATFVASFLVARVSWRKLALGGLVLMVAANVMTTGAHGFGAFVGARLLSGIGAGTLVAIATVALGRTDKPDRWFGILFATALGFASVALWSLPTLFERYGLNVAYWIMASLAVACSVTTRSLPATAPAPVAAGAEVAGSRHVLLIALVLLAVLVFFAEQNAVWAYAERIGSAASLDAHFIGRTLGLANFAGLGGALVVAWLGKRAGRLLPIVGASAVQLAALLMLRGSPTAAAYMISTAGLAVAWNVVNPFQLGVLAELDETGRALPLAATFTGLGLALGPALGASVLTGAGYAPVLWLAAGLAVTSVALILPALRRTS
jgi:predicted MFS family arabinose efflux permease